MMIDGWALILLLSLTSGGGASSTNVFTRDACERAAAAIVAVRRHTSAYCINRQTGETIVFSPK